jgi:hypothetical protein
LRELQALPAEELLNLRYKKYRDVGHFEAGKEKAVKSPRRKKAKEKTS